MHIPNWLRKRLLAWAERYIESRPPDFNIGANDPDGIYMMRWWIIPRNPRFNIYLHVILRNDRDEALHDHPWWNLSIPLRSGYREMIPKDPDNPTGPVTIRTLWPGRVVLRKARAAHRIELMPFGAAQPPISLFITGPVVREWGFHCPKGWRSFKEFTAHESGTYGERGKGCGD
jgi:hypothetical protein